MLKMAILCVNINRGVIFNISVFTLTQFLHQVLCGEKLALLSATLRTYQKAACDTDQISISCPRGTCISIEFAQYNNFITKDGISLEDICPLKPGEISDTPVRKKSEHLLRHLALDRPLSKLSSDNNSINGLKNQQLNYTANINASPSPGNLMNEVTSKNIKVMVDSGDKIPENCMWPNALQYSLLQTVVEACQKKKWCKFHATPRNYDLSSSGVGDADGRSSYKSSTASFSGIPDDPCPKTRKIVEVAYKCRPYEFRSKVACHKEIAQLECNPYSRIAVYSASFGRTEYENIQCPQTQGIREETCLASYATETVMQICHGRRRCNLSANANTFGTPCQPNSRMYLKVVYTCVPKQVLNDRFESEMEGDESDGHEDYFNNIYDELGYKESEAIPKIHVNTTQAGTTVSLSVGNNNKDVNPIFENSSVLFEGRNAGINPVMTHSADYRFNEDRERTYLYILIAGSVSVLFCIVIVSVRLFLQKQNRLSDSLSESSLKAVGRGLCEDSAENNMANRINNTICKVDADIDTTTNLPLPMLPPNDQNYSSYALENVYGNMDASNDCSRTPSAFLLQSGCASNPGVLCITSNSIIRCGSTQSPDVIGIPSNGLVSSSFVSDIQCSEPDRIANVNSEERNNMGNTGCTSNQLSLYTTAPTLHARLVRGNAATDAIHDKSMSPVMAAAVLPVGVANTNYAPSRALLLPTISTLQRTKLHSTPHSPPPSPPQQQQFSYDDESAPRSLSTVLPMKADFYYG